MAATTEETPVGISNRNVLDLFSLKGRTIIITGTFMIKFEVADLKYYVLKLILKRKSGAAGGLGLNFANACVQAGANVAAIDISPSPHADFLALEKSGLKVKYYRYVVISHTSCRIRGNLIVSS